MAEAKDIAQLLINKKVKKQEEVAYPKPFSNEIQFDRNEVLGSGNSVVYRGTNKGLPVAVKRIVVDLLSKEDREIRTQVQLDHENVLKIVTVEQDSDFRYIVLELCEGTLADVINKTYKGPELSSDINVLNEIATGLDYIHSKKLVHRDIKPDNILISSNGRIKLSDFGLCKETSTNHTFSVSGPLKGTRFWMAQELLNTPNDNSTQMRGSIKSDIFSAGCVFFYFVTRGIHPFGDEDSVQGNIRAGNIMNFDRLSQSHFASDITRSMLQYDPNKRITLEEIRKQFSDYQPITARMNKKRATNIIRRMVEMNSFMFKNLTIEKYHETNSLRVDYCLFGKSKKTSPLLKNSIHRRKKMLMFELSSETINVVDAMINYVLDVKWEDNIRFKLNCGVISDHTRTTLFHLNEIKGTRLGYPFRIVIDPEPFGHHTRTERFQEEIDIQEEIQEIFRPLADEIKQEPDAFCLIIPLEENGIESLKSTYQELLRPLTVNSQNFLNQCRFVVANFANSVEFNTSTRKDELISLRNKIFVDFGRGRIAQDENLYKFIFSSVFMLNSHQDVQNRANFEMNVKNFDEFFTNL